MELEELIKEVKEKISEKRFNHCMGVMKRAEILAKIYGIDAEKAKKVAIVHDVAREMSVEENFKYIKENNIEIDEIEKNNMTLLHGKIGADIAKKQYGFDKEMQQAILYHTTGYKDMDMLAKIIYVADKTEDGRTYDENLKSKQELSEEDIDACIVCLIDASININIQRKNLIDPNSIFLRNKLMLKNQKSN